MEPIVSFRDALSQLLEARFPILYIESFGEQRVTVKAYVSRLLAKLDLNNRGQVALLVHDAGLV